MKLPFRLFCAASLPLLAIPMAADAQLRICSWNVTNYTSNGTAPSNSRDDDFALAFYGVVPSGLALQGRSMSPDVIIGQEFISQTAVNTFRAMLNSAPGSPGDWAAAPFLDGPDTDSAFFYRTSRVQYLATWTIALGSASTCNQPRDTRRYDFRPLGYAAPGATLAVYSVHLKAQGSNTACPGGENAEGRRLIECQRIRDNAEGIDTNPNWTPGTGGSNPPGSSGLPAGYLFMMAGDTNIQSSTRPDYQELVGTQANNAGRLFDPIASPGTWNNNGAFRYIFTQDPATSAGMDDRHDQILICADLLDSDGLSYIFVPGTGGAPQTYSTTTWNDPNHTYRCWGSDGGAFNAMLRTTGNTFVGPAIAQALINSAASGGHMPVMADFRVPAKASATASIAFGQVVQNTVATRSLPVSNAGDVTLWTATGIDTLRYTLAASGGFFAPAGQFVDGAGGGVNTHTISMDTSTVGVKSGTITIASNDPDVPALVVTLTGEVVPSTPVNQPPVANAGPDQFVNNQSGSGSELVTLNGSLSHDDGTIVNYRWSEGATVLATGAASTPTVSLPVGAHSILLTVTDNGNLSGTDTVLVTVNGRPTANAGPDQTINDQDGSGAESVAVSGAASTDPDDGIATYRWSEGATILAQGASPTASFTLAAGTHTVTLRVTDAHGAFHDDQVILTVNARPVANAGPDQTVTDSDNSGAETVNLNGSASSDPDDGIAAYRWSEGATVLADGPSPTAAVSLGVGAHTITLRVTDAHGAFDTDDVLITVNAGPPACPADFNGDGNVDPDDLGDFITCFFGDPPCAGADFNADGNVDPDDLGDFITAFFASAC